MVDERQRINTCYTSTTLLALFEIHDLSIFVPSGFTCEDERFTKLVNLKTNFEHDCT